MNNLKSWKCNFIQLHNNNHNFESKEEKVESVDKEENKAESGIKNEDEWH